MKKAKYTLIGEGDGGVSLSDWAAPMSNCPTLLSIHDNCEAGEFEFPLNAVSAFLVQRGFRRKPLAAEAQENLQLFLEEALGDDISVAREHYDHGPGASGLYYKVFLRTKQLKSVEALLFSLEEFLILWSEGSGLNTALNDLEMRAFSAASRLQAETREAEQQLLQQQAISTQKWEDELLRQVCQSVVDETPNAFARLHFMVFKGRIFVLEKEGWWHTLRGNPLKVARLISDLGLGVTRVTIRSSSRGWIPYFARKHEEEPGLGWFDSGLEVDPCSSEIDALISEARSTLVHS
jgi:hypothetical protein